MEKKFLEEFVKKALEENEKKEDGEKRKKHFQEIGRKGGLKKENITTIFKNYLRKINRKRV